MTDLDLIKFVLAIIALYCLGMWVWTFLLVRFSNQHKIAIEADPAYRSSVAEFTFRVGITGTVAIGVLGIIFSLQGH